jgi:hypothetical protein
LLLSIETAALPVLLLLLRTAATRLLHYMRHKAFGILLKITDVLIKVSKTNLHVLRLHRVVAERRRPRCQSSTDLWRSAISLWVSRHAATVATHGQRLWNQMQLNLGIFV